MKERAQQYDSAEPAETPQSPYNQNDKPKHVTGNHEEKKIIQAGKQVKNVCIIHNKKPVFLSEQHRLASTNFSAQILSITKWRISVINTGTRQLNCDNSWTCLSEIALHHNYFMCEIQMHRNMFTTGISKPILKKFN